VKFRRARSVRLPPAPIVESSVFLAGCQRDGSSRQATFVAVGFEQAAATLPKGEVDHGLHNRCGTAAS
jgi:hypothetical protein